MGAPTPPVGGSEAGPGRVRRMPSRRVFGPAVVGVVTFVLLVGAVVLAMVRSPTVAVPGFPSLAATPDPALHGTVAYLADATGCVRVVAAAGRPARDVLCPEAQDPAEAERSGKLVGPQLVWREDGRLEITMFRLTDPPGPTFRPGWQKVIDIGTDRVEEVTGAAVPSVPAPSTQPTTRADGATVSFTSSAEGRVTVGLREGGQDRTLLSVRGPGEGTYRLAGAFWAPDGRWVAADDGRILVISPGPPVVVRILTDESTRGGYGGYPRFAVTGRDLLAPAG